MLLTPLPDAPSTADPANFATKADALVAALPGLVTEINALGDVNIGNASTLNGTNWTAPGPIGGTTPGAGSFTAVTATSFAGAALAAQSDQETGTSTSKAVTPGVQKFHPSAAKGWVNVGVSGDIQQSYNVTSVTDAAAGQIIVNWNVDFSAGNYCVIGQGIATSSGTAATFYDTRTSTTPAAGSSTHTFLRASDYQPVDPATWAVVAFGDQ